MCCRATHAASNSTRFRSHAVAVGSDTRTVGETRSHSFTMAPKIARAKAQGTAGEGASSGRRLSANRADRAVCRLGEDQENKKTRKPTLSSS